MTVEHERQLWAAFKNHGDMQAREELILSYVPFTKNVVLGCAAVRGCDSFDDAISEAYVALIQCVDKFDPDMGNQFTTMASRRIKGTVKDFARKAFGMFSPRNHRVIPVPLSEFDLPGEEGDDYVHDVVLEAPDQVLAERNAQDDRASFGELLMMLPANWRAVLLLKIFEGFSHVEIAEALGFSYDRSVQIQVLLKRRLQQFHREGLWPWHTVH